ncbi:fumarylacetoacetate hydrolase family protein [Desulfotomaculum nigrificans]|uniref:fumarylacetoacetate hydrolase family protein n=1 Tax=Desulfotomaculum nigrificans TaxID=1565 RepID=UPI0001FADE22|nr:fumarylacetoacetate hydrolase family protein [Desulfotomaculum nigrificans]
MKFARFKAEGHEYYGLVEGQTVRVIEGNIYDNYTLTDRSYPVSEVKLLPPVKPTKVIGVGLNYKAVAQAKGVEFPAEPVLFLKPPSSVIGPGDSILIPPAVKNPAFEVELAVIIGKQAKNVSADSAFDYVLGYCLANDVTAKDHMIKGKPWTKGKSFDTFTPMGPYVVTDIDPDDTVISVSVNGEQKQLSNTSDMIFNVRELIAFISGVMTLEPGDVILTGTPPGGGNFNIGDVIKLSGPQLGEMVNDVRVYGI